MKAIKISKVEIEMGEGKKLSLSLEQAKELKRILNDTFPDLNPVFPIAPIIIEKHIYPWEPVYPPLPQPYWYVKHDSTTGSVSCLVATT